MSDRRSRQIIYVSSCLLNQNRRYPGIATNLGAINPLIKLLLERNFGIEQLPCLECLAWGGFTRKTIFKFIPILYRQAPNFNFIIRVYWIFWKIIYRWKCRKEARKIITQIIDQQKSGMTVNGFILMNDSPTCGTTLTIDLLDSICSFKSQGVPLEDLMHPTLEKMKILIHSVLMPGEGFFTSELKSLLSKYNINACFYPFNPWNKIEDEIQQLELKE